MALQRVAILAGLFALLSILFSAQATPLEKRASRTTPPSGSVVVRGSGTQSGEFSTVQAAVNSLPNDSSARTIFIYPGDSHNLRPFSYLSLKTEITQELTANKSISRGLES
jgi:pectin methylesterase-like acyl-CoA thioesterase